ncbi:hypothetical protein CAPTEDRAFT_222498 [Capitella teleta]|uniref:Large ribosomal subunit protein mL42 n=1 Tax=Capitella teleta TaxID=283909 RepID=R7UH03_CAPTE|nr:hypothetical protein CAPTEDRAFT_222498 [Capitella teleta]|eukprot:ELU02547.1 hypothetical protein CAPTEDRAFT_222498 [Capitella teleta]
MRPEVAIGIVLHEALQLSRRTSACRLFSTSPVSSSSTSDQSQNIGFSRDGSTIICWHPEPDYPYEHSKPLPRSLPELQENEWDEETDNKLHTIQPVISEWKQGPQIDRRGEIVLARARIGQSHLTHGYLLRREADTSALKVQVKQDYVTRFSKDGPTDRELTQMFSTTKHTWYPKAQARNKWYRRKFEKDREAL